VSLTEREKIAALISQAMTLYAVHMQEGNIPEHQSIIDFVLKSIPEQHRKSLSMDMIDEIFAFISTNHMEPS